MWLTFGTAPPATTPINAALVTTSVTEPTNIPAVHPPPFKPADQQIWASLRYYHLLIHRYLDLRPYPAVKHLEAQTQAILRPYVNCSRPCRVRMDKPPPSGAKPITGVLGLPDNNMKPVFTEIRKTL